MNCYIKHKRTDGKFLVSFAYDNGVRLAKVRTPDQWKRDYDKSDEGRRISALRRAECGCLSRPAGWPEEHAEYCPDYKGRTT